MGREEKLGVILDAKDRMASAFRSAGDKLNKYSGSVTAVATSYQAVRQLAGDVQRAWQSLAGELITQSNELQNYSLRLGVGVEQLDALGFAAQTAGIPTNQLTVGLQRMTRRIAEAAAGTGEAKGTLDALGISIDDLARQSPDEQFLRMADAISGLSTQSDRVRVAFKLFDTEGVGLVQTMGDGRRGIEQMMERARDLGLITGDLTEKTADFREKMVVLERAFRAVKIAIVEELLGALDESDIAFLMDVFKTAAKLAGQTTKFVIEVMKDVSGADLREASAIAEKLNEDVAAAADSANAFGAAMERAKDPFAVLTDGAFGFAVATNDASNSLGVVIEQIMVGGLEQKKLTEEEEKWLKQINERIERQGWAIRERHEETRKLLTLRPLLDEVGDGIEEVGTAAEDVYLRVTHSLAETQGGFAQTLAGTTGETLDQMNQMWAAALVNGSSFENAQKRIFTSIAAHAIAELNKIIAKMIVIGLIKIGLQLAGADSGANAFPSGGVPGNGTNVPIGPADRAFRPRFTSGVAPGGGGGVNLRINVQTGFGSRGEGIAVARTVASYLQEAGVL